jgi:hypothetical protein
MQVDHCPAYAAAEFYQITELVHDPQPVATAPVRARLTPPGERVGDVAGVLDLADQLIPRGPDGQDTACTSVAKGVSGKLAHGEHQVEDTVWGQADAAGMPGSIRPRRSQVCR